MQFVFGRRLLFVFAMVVAALEVSAACSNPVGSAGELMFNTTHKVLQYCNGTSWINAGASNPGAPQTGCANPVGEAGSFFYNSNEGVVQFCNGSAWVDTACSITRKKNGSGCVNPAGKAGEMIYESTTNELLFCDSTDWVAMGYPCSGECILPWGGVVNSGDSVTAYQADTVPYGSTCQSQTRTCTVTNLSGTYQYQSCSVAAPAECGLPWGGQTAHGSSVTAYQDAVVPFGSSCQSESRTCNNGSLSGSYGNESCSVTPPADCSLPWGGTLTHGNSVTAYQNSSVPHGNTCASQTRTCNNGTLSGTYTHQSCTVLPPPANCTLPWGGTLNHGSSVTAYQSSNVPYGSSCQGESRTCNDGNLSGSYTNQNCSVTPPANCSLPWGGSISHGNSVTAYSTTSVSCGYSCSSYSQTRTCNNGSLSGSYSYQSCYTETCYSYDWYTGSWGSCNAYCGGGNQSRTVYCRRSDGVAVSDGNCSGPRPSADQYCIPTCGQAIAACGGTNGCCASYSVCGQPPYNATTSGMSSDCGGNCWWR